MIDGHSRHGHNSETDTSPEPRQTLSESRKRTKSVSESGGNACSLSHAQPVGGGLGHAGADETI
eukprot:62972-Rhodomonas_salina.2